MDGQRHHEFPDVESKLQAAPKKSLFERQRAEAEAKRQREEAETAAVYSDFVKAFNHDADDGDSYGDAKRSNRLGGGVGGGGGGGGGGSMSGSRRHFGNRMGAGTARISGPGSLGPPPSNLSKKRTYDSLQAPSRRDHGRDPDRGAKFDDQDGSNAAARAFNSSDDEADASRAGGHSEPALPKPTLRLMLLPPGTSPTTIKALMTPHLTVEDVKILPTQAPANSTERKSMAAIVTLAKDTPANDIDAAVSALQNRYLGYGYYLSLHRGLSSAAVSTTAMLTTGTSNANSMPFGAQQAVLPPANPTPQGPHRGFAPPASFAPPSGQMRSGPLYYVHVRPPQDLGQLRLIHKTIELMLTHGPAFEALLMSRPDVQKQERWAWLWDSRSAGGIWYRWRLWEVLTGSKRGQRKGKYLPLFEGSSAWKAPSTSLPFEFATQLDEFVSDSDYHSSDDDESDDERKLNQGGAPQIEEDGPVAFLNPMEKAKLTHLLARLPTSTARLRKGDVARITGFAIAHANRGADEIVSDILSNVEKPFAYTSANPGWNKKGKSENESAPPGAGPSGDEEDRDEEDNSSARMIGLYVISDILSASSTSGVRHAWRYRAMFEAALKHRNIFESLGRMDKKMRWGRLRAEKWKRSVGNLLSLWEGWCVFSQTSQEHFSQVFHSPPLTAEEQEREAAQRATATKSKWKAVEESTAPAVDDGGFRPEQFAPPPATEEPDGEPMLESDENLDGEPMEEDDDDFYGEPLEYGEVAADPMEGEDVPAGQESNEGEVIEDSGAGPIAVMESQDDSMADVAVPRGKRMKAEDMFAASDEE